MEIDKIPFYVHKKFTPIQARGQVLRFGGQITFLGRQGFSFYYML